MPDTPSPAETIAAARELFVEALNCLEAAGVEVELRPTAGAWGYWVGGTASAEGGIVALVALMRIGGPGGMR